MKRELLLACALCGGLLANAEHIDVTSLRYAGPYVLQRPFMVDSTDVDAEEWVAKDWLDTPLSLSQVFQTGGDSDGISLSSDEGNDSYALHLLGFVLENTHYGEAELKVKGTDAFLLYVDGVQTKDMKLKLEPATHQIVVKYLSAPGGQVRPTVSLETSQDGIFSLRQDEGRMFTLSDVLHGTRFTGVELSADGQYLMTAYQTGLKDGKSRTYTRITHLKSGKTVAERSESLHWMPRSCKYYYTRQGVSGRQLVTVDPVTGMESVWIDNLPDGEFRIAPTEDFLLFTLVQEGPKERKDIYEVIDPDDRQPGWRNRTYLARYDLKTGLMQRLTFGYRNVWSTDIASDGRSLLMMVSTHRMGKRPTTLSSLYRLDLETLKAEELVKEDGFISNAVFSPDAGKVLITGSPEALGGIGKNVKEGQIPSMIDNQLFLMDLSDKKISPLTKYFNPNVQRAVWSKADGKVYFTAENRDCYSLYCLDTEKGDIRQLDVPEEMVFAFSAASDIPLMAFYGESASNSHRLYTVDLKKQRVDLKEDLSKDILSGIELGICEAWDFVSSKGDTICGRFYLPPHFDPSRKYPMIVNYYGGCSPTSRDFESRYPHHAYAALGYVVYVIQPSGATGFGQEFSARHVNTFGDCVAEDIIEGTRKFIEEHPYVNAKKIGCIGASYGGFMTQYLQTKTDLFAAAISHAGISDHTSYWGEGYWGYSYSEVSAAHSYPWKNKELFVDHSPLFNAEKVHTPLLFLHGAVDTNVPVGESIQMFTALKLLGRETAMVLVEGQDHHILDYGKRIRWQNTIFAWFAKWLQDDPTWWNVLYKPKTL